MRLLLLIIVGGVVAGGIGSMIFGFSLGAGIQHPTAPHPTIVTHVTQETAPPMPTPPDPKHHYQYQHVVWPAPVQSASGSTAKGGKAVAPVHGCTVTNRTSTTTSSTGKVSTTVSHQTVCK